MMGYAEFVVAKVTLKRYVLVVVKSAMPALRAKVRLLRPKTGIQNPTLFLVLSVDARCTKNATNQRVIYVQIANPKIQ